MYPLLLVNQFLSELRISNVLTKLDIVGAYQLMQVTEDYEYLTAFRTRFQHMSPQVSTRMITDH